jgi:hypothetical protein
MQGDPHAAAGHVDRRAIRTRNSFRSHQEINYLMIRTNRLEGDICGFTEVQMEINYLMIRTNRLGDT